jgi:hypothetical protein
MDEDNTAIGAAKYISNSLVFKYKVPRQSDTSSL